MNIIQFLKEIINNNIPYDHSFDYLDEIYKLHFPVDYKILMKSLKESTYFLDFIFLLNVEKECKRVKDICLAYCESKNAFPDDFIHSPYPAENCIFPCAVTDNGDEIYWLTSDWSIVVYEARSSNYYKYNMTISEFLYKISTNEIICPAFPDDL